MVEEDIMTFKERAEVLEYFKEMVCKNHLPISTCGTIPDLDGDVIWYKHRIYCVDYMHGYVFKPKWHQRFKIILMDLKYRYLQMRKNMILKSLEKKNR